MNRPLITVLSVQLVCVFLLAGKAQAHPAWGIAVDRQGQIYFSDLTTVWKVDVQGKVSVVRGKENRHTHDLNVDDAGNLYGADNSYEPATNRFFSAIWRLTPTGNFSYLLSPTDDPPEGTSIWRDNAGNSFHATTFPRNELLVLKRSPNGNVSVLVGDKNATRNYRQGVPYSLGGLAIDRDGVLYFVHGANVSKLSIDNTLIPLARNVVIEKAATDREGTPSPTQLLGIAINANGVAFVADYGNRRVLKISPDSQSTTLIRSEEPYLPTGVACLGDDVYILENSFTRAHAPLNTRVRKLSSDGRVTVVATVGDGGVVSGSSSSVNNPVEGSERSQPKRTTRNLLIAAGIGILALTVIVWRVLSIRRT